MYENGNPKRDQSVSITASRDDPNLGSKQDGLAIWLGALILAGLTCAIWNSIDVEFNRRAADLRMLKRTFAASSHALTHLQMHGMRQEIRQGEAHLSTRLQTSFQGWIVKPREWFANPFESLYASGKYNLFPGIVAMGMGLWFVLVVSVWLRGESAVRFSSSFPLLFLLVILAELLTYQSVARQYQLQYPLWGFLIGLSVRNILAIRNWLNPAVQTEFYLNTGLILMGCEILLSQLLLLGVSGVAVSWITTSVALLGTYWAGRSVLRSPSKTLNMVLSSAMAVCGFSAVIATAAACRSRRSELMIAIFLSMGSTMIMMVVMPPVLLRSGLNSAAVGAWLGSTLDATSATNAATEILAPTGMFVAATIKSIQNILMCGIVLAVALSWTGVKEQQFTMDQLPKSISLNSSDRKLGISAVEFWRRFPKLILGFVLISVIFSVYARTVPSGEYLVNAVIKAEQVIREWFWGLAFVSLGLELNLKDFRDQTRDGRVLILALIGQSLNLLLAFLLAWLTFHVAFPDFAKHLQYRW